MIRTPRIETLAATVALMGACALTGVGFAQSDAETEDALPPDSEIKFSVTSRFEQAFESALDGAGDLEVSRAYVGIGLHTELERDLDLTLNFSYGLDQYDFRGTTILGGVEPWEDIHTVGFTARFDWAVTNDWSVFVGPVAQFSREADADWLDAWIAGGLLGVTHKVDDSLVVGAGLGVVTQIEDDPRAFPILVLNWKISERFRLTTMGGGGMTGATGVELTYDLGDDWEIAVGGRYEFRRFRLDGVGVAPDGVADETSLPLWIRLSNRLGKNFSVDLYGGLINSGELELEDSSGNLIAADDFEAALYAGVAVRIRF